jgi:hypothetical protein
MERAPMDMTYAGRVAGAVLLAAAVVPGGAVRADDEFLSWSDIIKRAMADYPGLTMEMAHAFAAREKQFAGFAPWMDAHFDDGDTNDDGMVTMVEMRAWVDVHHMSDADLSKAWYEQARE